MSKLYVGNLPAEVNEGTLRQLFQEHSLSCNTILVKRGGYAFVECTDQSTADKAIDKLNVKQIIGLCHHTLLIPKETTTSEWCCNVVHEISYSRWRLDEETNESVVGRQVNWDQHHDWLQNGHATYGFQLLEAVITAFQQQPALGSTLVSSVSVACWLQPIPFCGNTAFAPG
uniref:RRM domain-containing protein n=1 Tax=Timema poppense TaxID=170557 RepID=A0A7R9H5M9_TIMPO|nr:unnamed protein product [Timema poppensis]